MHAESLMCTDTHTRAQTEKSKNIISASIHYVHLVVDIYGERTWSTVRCRDTGCRNVWCVRSRWRWQMLARVSLHGGVPP